MAQANGRTNGHSNLKFWGWRRENGRVGVRNHVAILPLDDLSNAACEAVANNIKGTLALPRLRAPAVRRGSRSALRTRHRLEPKRGRRGGDRGRLDPARRRRHRQDRQARDGVRNRGNRRHHDDRQGLARRQEYLQWASELRREECDIADLWVSTKCGESDTTTGLSSCPTVGNMYDKLIPHGIHGCFGETSEITGAEHLAKERAASPEVGEKWYRLWKAYQDDVIEAHKTDDLSDSQPTKATSRAVSPSRRRPSATSRRSGASAATSMRSTRGSARQGPSVLHGHVFRGRRMSTLMAAGGYVVHTFPTVRATSSATRSSR